MNEPTGPRLQFTKCESTMRHFRCPFDIKDLPDPKVVKVGSNNLHCSGSGQFGQEHLQQLETKVSQVAQELHLTKPDIWILDLRTERHFFSDGNPVIWKFKNDHLLDLNKSTSEIIQEEDQLISEISKATVVWDRAKQPITLGDTVILKEKDLVEQQGFHYLRLPILEHFKPTDECVENLVNFVITHPNAWIHAHCYVKARTTVALVIVDMLYNARDVSFEDILYRQQVIDGSDLTKIPEKTSEFHDASQERLNFLRNFYAYCKEADPLNDASCTWKNWKSKK